MKYKKICEYCGMEFESIRSDTRCYSKKCKNKSWESNNIQYYKEYQKEYQKEYYNINKEYIKEKQKQYRKNNKESIKQYKKEYYNINKKSIKQYYKEYYNINKKSIIQYHKEYKKKRYQTDLNYKMRRNLSSRISMAVRDQATDKSKKTLDLLGCSISYLKKYLENKFKPGMSWDNYGEWHIDHIIPCVLYDLTDIEQQKKCFHYTNLQPLWAQENISKGCKIKIA